MNVILHYSLLLLLPSVILLHLYFAPYTKVEESFNIQAIHDIILYGTPLNDLPFSEFPEWFRLRYDHFTFPGAVPRTFVGALVLAQIAVPFVKFIERLADVQLFVRGILGLSNGFALLSVKSAVDVAYGKTAGYWYILLQASQFHVMYYASRTLPNMFAFGLTTVALRFFILSSSSTRSRRSNRQRLTLYLLTIAGVIFRSEIAILLGAITLTFLTSHRASIQHVILPAGILAATIALVITVTVDSFFWQQFPLWPEWVGFRYNTLEGKSSEWGISPWHFYFFNAIPRLVFNPFALLVCLPLACVARTTRRFTIELIAPYIAFIAFYSILPHKEWRFIIYAVPSLTAAASAGAAQIWNRRHKSSINTLVAMTLVLSTIASFSLSAGLLAISSLNYPGAHALNRLHVIAANEQGSSIDRPIAVHLDNLACQTGVTHFLQFSPPLPNTDSSHFDPETPSCLESQWLYDKTEDTHTLLQPEFWERFDYVIAESPERVIGRWEVVEDIYAFAGIRLVNEHAGIDRYGEEVAWERQVNPKTNQPATLSANLTSAWHRVEVFARKYVTRGRWPLIKMESRLKILKKQTGDMKEAMAAAPT